MPKISAPVPDTIIATALFHICKALTSIAYGNNNPNYAYSQLKIAMDHLETIIGPQPKANGPQYKHQNKTEQQQDF